ncbi:transporter substrate-binding domain-containing protein [Desulfohalobium retbaense]|uniref:Extracellular solute-binding protein family 3 n=1 Tax=Desulfohalobium retbaense (strain ATCC 49708 / DSM 5692 / JCM 16813 / HR100) TaxID=485915 RepID=C8X5S5_DESRD|nr:transporter substrate-binding domain-containing protein [Desulfohalobium retbaense]ACV69772.1 extracellular solute-binding protein family 3 [Desulfohalobium retbaense DSM 5692]
MAKQWLAALVVVFVCLGGLSAQAADIELAQKSTLERILKSGELRVGFDPGYMPFEMTDTKGRYVGFDIALAKEMAKSMGVKFVPVNTDFDGIIPALLTKKFDIIISGITVTQERNLQINFSDPYIVVGQTILLRKGLEEEVESYRDLNDGQYTVASRLGTTGEMAAKRYMPKADYKSYEKEADGALEVLNGQVDAFVYDLPFNAIFNAQQGKGKVAFLDEPFTYEPLAFGIRKGDPDFLNWLNNFLRQIKNDGRYDRIYDKWFNSDDWLDTVQ